jgi:hypothetical protein
MLLMSIIGVMDQGGKSETPPPVIQQPEPK